MKLVSACLAGVNCTYKETNNICPKVAKLVKNGEAIPVCPEQLGGLPTPREAAELQNGKARGKSGDDYSKEFTKGAEEGVRIAQLADCTEAILKSRSPSCGKGKIYDGTFTKNLIDGNGIFAQKLIDNGISVKTNEDL